MEKKETKILGYEKGIPVIEVEHRKKNDFPNGYQFYCIYCKKTHKHGEGLGDRTSHCNNKNSPFYMKDYILKLGDSNEITKKTD